MIDDQGYIRVIDLGLSKKLDKGRTDTVCGTPHYLAPEILYQQGYGFSVDFWSLGVMLYEMICGFLPINDPS